jgi:hypothetical protein
MLARVSAPLLILLHSVASAADCADVVERTAVAFVMYDNAELERARDVIGEAYAGLSCQSAPVPPEVLLALYRLDALVALSQDDKKGVVYATLRAVAVDPVGARPSIEEYGPELAAEYDLWAERLAADQLTVSVEGAGPVWVDGFEVTAGSPRSVVGGEHLLQRTDPSGAFVSEVRELTQDLVVSAGAVVVAPTPAPAPVPVPEPLPLGRRRPAWLVAGTVVGYVGSGAAIATAYRSEAMFRQASFLPDGIGSCAAGEACYPRAREELVRSKARTINTAYGLGYGLAVVSSGLLTVVIAGIPGR